MSDMNLSISGTKRLLTMGKYCDKNIVITASGSGDFMDTYQKGLETSGYGYGFAGGGWSDAVYDPPRQISITRTAGYAFAYSKITNTKVPIIVDTENIYNTLLFYNADKLKTIPSLKVTDKVTTFTNWFSRCTALEEVNFTADSVIGASISFVDSPKLTNASVQTVINALKDLTGATSQTLTLHATVGAALSPEQKAAITAKNWQLVY